MLFLDFFSCELVFVFVVARLCLEFSCFALVYVYVIM